MTRFKVSMPWVTTVLCLSMTCTFATARERACRGVISRGQVVGVYDGGDCDEDYGCAVVVKSAGKRTVLTGEIPAGIKLGTKVRATYERKEIYFEPSGSCATFDLMTRIEALR